MDQIGQLQAEPKGPQTLLLAGGRRLALDAVRRTVHGIADGAAEEDRGNGDAGADDRQDQRILGGRSPALVFPKLNKSAHDIALRSDDGPDAVASKRPVAPSDRIHPPEKSQSFQGAGHVRSWGQESA